MLPADWWTRRRCAPRTVMLRHVARAAGLPSAVLRAQVPTITSHSMDRAGIAPFEERAAAAEAQLAALEQRVDAVAAQGQAPAADASAAASAHRCVCMCRLGGRPRLYPEGATTPLRARLIPHSTPPPLAQLEAENGQLKAQNAKLQYRVKHVLRSLSAAEQAQKVQKLQYRVLHLMRALETAEARLEGACSGSRRHSMHANCVKLSLASRARATFGGFRARRTCSRRACDCRRRRCRRCRRRSCQACDCGSRSGWHRPHHAAH